MYILLLTAHSMGLDTLPYPFVTPLRENAGTHRRCGSHAVLIPRSHHGLITRNEVSKGNAVLYE